MTDPVGYSRRLRSWAAELVAASRPDEHERRLLLVILVLAGFVRVLWCVYAARTPVGLHDPGLYRVFGERLADGEGYTVFDGSPTAYFPVGYPLVLAAAFLVSPAAWHTGVVAGVNIVAQLASVALVFGITKRVLGGRSRAALLAAAFVALWPNLVINSAVALSESVFVVLVLAMVSLAVTGPWGDERPSFRHLAAIGMLLGAATLVRPVSPPLLGVLTLAWLVGRAGWRRALRSTAVVAVVAAATLAPWVVRNAVVMNGAVLTTNTGDNLCMSRRVGGSGGFEYPNPRCNSGPFDSLPRPAFEIERDRHGQRLAFEFVRDHPIEEVRLWFRRLRYALWSDDDGIAAAESYGEDVFLGSGTRRALGRLANAYYYVVGGAGVLGLALLAWSRRPAAVLVALAPLSLLVAVMATFGDPRFKMPILPFLAIGAGAFADRLDQRRNGAGERTQGPTAGPEGFGSSSSLRLRRGELAKNVTATATTQSN